MMRLLGPGGEVLGSCKFYLEALVRGEKVCMYVSHEIGHLGLDI